MRVVVQQILVTWSKPSRGAPGAVARNVVPDGFPLPPEVTEPSRLAVHGIHADEGDGFAPAWDGAWWYHQLVVNVAWLPDGAAPAALFTGLPAVILDERVRLR